MRWLLAVALVLLWQIPYCVIVLGDASSDSLTPRAVVPRDEFSAASLPMGLDGCCPVVLRLESKWVRGNNRYRAEYEGRTYFFAAEHLLDAFLDNPARFAPVASGTDVVALEEEGLSKMGDRRHGVFFRDRVFLFVNEENLATFWQNPKKYAAPYMNLEPRKNIAVTR